MHQVDSLIGSARSGCRDCKPLCAGRAIAAAVSEALEARMLLSFSPAGGEFRVNTFTTNLQNMPAVASDPAGDFLIAWTSLGQQAGYGVYAQRYNAAGAAQGGEFHVNVAGTASHPAVAMDADGDFVVAWQSYARDGSGYAIMARRYNAVGVAQSSDFRVNTNAPNYQTTPTVAMDNAGDFVIAWASLAQDGSNYGVYAQRFNALGVAQGTEFRVNTT